MKDFLPISKEDMKKRGWERCVGCEQCAVCTRVGCRYSQSGIAHNR